MFEGWRQAFLRLFEVFIGHLLTGLMYNELGETRIFTYRPDGANVDMLPLSLSDLGLTLKGAGFV